MRLRVDPQYEKSLKRLPKELARRAGEQLRLFACEPRHPSLHFEKLTGWPDYHTIRVNRGYRILLRREFDAAGDLYAVVDVQPHDQAYRRR